MARGDPSAQELFLLTSRKRIRLPKSAAKESELLAELVDLLDSNKREISMPDLIDDAVLEKIIHYWEHGGDVRTMFSSSDELLQLVDAAIYLQAQSLKHDLAIVIEHEICKDSKTVADVLERLGLIHETLTAEEEQELLELLRLVRTPTGMLTHSSSF
ncbi:hypothetical protein SELMODRAFT_423730 [Selaginella moellendorffii]|uniref:SKP1 component POZ domain-containing protein n=1 Tax=Selaginella moellendorffii TaxID=88036 RepID=D8SMP3_SELML|nr:hypothetical protein SELMODRAFT_423730 [Selaginella moellendorffii]